MKASRTQICIYMNENITDHVDPLTGEVNNTSLAEDACTHFNAFINEDDIPNIYFDLAFRIADQYEIKTGVKTVNYSRLSGLINSQPPDRL